MVGSSGDIPIPSLVIRNGARRPARAGLVGACELDAALGRISTYAGERRMPPEQTAQRA